MFIKGSSPNSQWRFQNKSSCGTDVDNLVNYRSLMPVQEMKKQFKKNYLTRDIKINSKSEHHWNQCVDESISIVPHSNRIHHKEGQRRE